MSIIDNFRVRPSGQHPLKLRYSLARATIHRSISLS